MSLVVATIVFPFAAFAQSEPIDLTATFVKNGAVIEDLAAFQIGGIVVIRGKTSARTRAEEAGRIAMTLGYLASRTSSPWSIMPPPMRQS